jgi:hypothetical protein
MLEVLFFYNFKKKQGHICVHSMFILSVIKDSLRIIPSEFSKDLQEVVLNELNKKYANKVRKLEI